MKKIIIAFTLIFLSSTTVAAQIPSSEEAVPSTQETAEPTAEESLVEIKEEVKEIEIRPSGEAVEVQVQTEQRTQPIQTFPLPTESRKIVEVEVQDLPTTGTRPISLEQTPQGNIEIKDDKISATTLLPVKVSEQKISVEVKDMEETVILPSQAVKAVIEVEPTDSEEPRATVLDVELLECVAKEGPEPPDCKVVYKIETEEENEFLGLIPVKSRLSYEVDATSGKLLATRKPWYLRIFSFLFA